MATVMQSGAHNPAPFTKETPMNDFTRQIERTYQKAYHEGYVQAEREWLHHLIEENRRKFINGLIVGSLTTSVTIASLAWIIKAING